MCDVAISERPHTQRQALRLLAKDGGLRNSRTASFLSLRDLRGQALPLVTVVRFDSPRPKPRPWLRCSGASQGAPRPRPTRRESASARRTCPARRLERTFPAAH